MMEDKNTDANKAFIQLEQQTQALKTRENYWKAYTLSVLLPPIGIYYFIKYFFFKADLEGARKAAFLNLILTIISLLLNIWLIGWFFSQSIPGGSQNLDTLKELNSPESQKSLQQLLQ